MAVRNKKYSRGMLNVNMPPAVSLQRDLLGWWEGDNQFSDSTGTVADLAPVNAMYANVEGKGGLGFAGDGTSAHCFTAHTAHLAKPTTAVTVCGWVKTNDVAANEQTIVAKGPMNNSKIEYGLEITNANPGVAAFHVGVDAFANVVGVTSLTANEWYFVCGTYYYPGSGTSTLKVWTGTAGGTLSDPVVDTADDVGPIDYTDTEDFVIGYSKQSSTKPLDGEVDKVGVWSRALSQLEVEALYNAGLGVRYPFSGEPQDSLLTDIVAYFKCEDKTDATGNFAASVIAESHTPLYGRGLQAGGKALGPLTGTVGGAGTGQNLTILNASCGDLLITSGDMTVCCWVKIDAVEGNYHFFGMGPHNDSTQKWSVGMASTEKARFTCEVGTVLQTVNANTAVTVGDWHFIVATRDGSTGDMIIHDFAKGASSPDTSPTAENTPGDLDATVDDFTIGCRRATPGNETTTYEWAGNIDGVGVWSRILTAAEILNLYNGGAGVDYPFDTTPSSLLTKATAAWTLNEADAAARADSTFNGYDLVNDQTADPVLTTGPVSAAVEFDPALDQVLRVDSANTSALNPGPAQDFSVCGWVYFDTTAAEMMPLGVWSEASPAANHRGWVLQKQAGGSLRFLISSNGTLEDGIVDSGVSPSATTWYFFHCYYKTATDVLGIRLGTGTTLSAAVETASVTAGPFSATSADFTMGGVDNGTLTELDGRLAEVTFFSDNLTEGEVVSLFNGGNGNPFPFLDNGSRVATDPYAGVNWGSEVQLKSQFHDHQSLSNSEGNDRWGAYDDAGYNAISAATYVGDNNSSGAILNPPGRQYPVADFITGGQDYLDSLTNISVTFDLMEQVNNGGVQHMTNCFLGDGEFIGYSPEGDYSTNQGLIDETNLITDALAIIAHPIGASAIFTVLTGFHGMEVYSGFYQKALDDGGGDSNATMLSNWDDVLAINPLIRCYAVNDHMGPYSEVAGLLAITKDSGKQIVYASAATEAAFKTAVTAGASVAIRDLGDPKDQYPTITSIEVSGDFIQIVVTGHTAVRWIADGSQVATGTTLDTRSLASGTTYVRAEIDNSDGSIIHTQAWALK